MTIMHHTAGAATESTNPTNKGNRKGANAGVVTYCVAKHNSVPYCNAVVDRDGTIYILAAGPVWHAGVGSFKGTRWVLWRIPDNSANGYTFGVEVVSKGRKPDFTAKQIESIDLLNCAVKKASKWIGFKYRIANHKDWTTRKIDTRYPWETFVEGAKAAWRQK
jgi:N-acetyl-anhydromuramyl-L-alanine amidase AmpD